MRPIDGEIGQAGPDLSGAGRPAHARGAPRRRRRDRARRRRRRCNFCKPAVDPLFTSAIDVWQGGIMSVILTGMGSDGMRGGKAIVAAGGSVIAAGRSHQRGVGHAGRRGAMPASARRCCRSIRSAEARSVVCGRPSVTPLDYEYLRKLLKERSGLDLSADKQYLVESRLLPLARKSSLHRHFRTGARR